MIHKSILGANVKTMVNKKFCLGMLVMALVFCLIVVGCSNGSSSPSYNNDAGELAGTWQGNVMVSGYGALLATVGITNSGWTISVPGASFADTGSFNRNGNSATLYSNTDGKNIGTATIIDSTTIKVVLNGNSVAPGTYTMTKL